MMEAVFSVFGIEIYKYSLYIMFASALFALSLYVKSRDLKADFFYVSAPLSLCLGLIFSRLFFAFLDANFLEILSLKNIVNLRLGGFSMFGFIFGVVLSQILAAKIVKEKPKKALDRVVLPLLVFVFFARLAEEGTGIGLSRPLVNESTLPTLFILNESYGSFIKTYILEALIALIMYVIFSFKEGKKQKEGSLFLSFLFLFGASQTLMESLRYDGHMSFSFIAVQQLLAVIILILPMILLAFSALKQKKQVPLAVIALNLAVIVPLIGLWLEFMIDRSQISKLVLYIAYALLLCAPVYVGSKLIDEVYNGER